MNATLTSLGDVDLEVVNPLLESRSPAEVVDWAVRQFGSELVMTSWTLAVSRAGR